MGGDVVDSIQYDNENWTETGMKMKSGVDLIAVSYNDSDHFYKADNTHTPDIGYKEGQKEYFLGSNGKCDVIESFGNPQSDISVQAYHYTIMNKNFIQQILI